MYVFVCNVLTKHRLHYTLGVSVQTTAYLRALMICVKPSHTEYIILEIILHALSRSLTPQWAFNEACFIATGFNIVTSPLNPGGLFFPGEVGGGLITHWNIGLMMIYAMYVT